jgi:hypothetical protein
VRGHVRSRHFFLLNVNPRLLYGNFPDLEEVKSSPGINKSDRTVHIIIVRPRMFLFSSFFKDFRRIDLEVGVWSGTLGAFT